MYQKKPHLKIRSQIAIILFLLSSTACSFLFIYRDIHELEGYQWLQAEIQTFEVEIKQAQKVNATLLLRHIEGAQTPSVKAEVTITSNQQEWKTIPVNIAIMNEDGDYLGNGSGDMWDVATPIFQGLLMEAGQYSFTIKQVQQARVPLIMEVGLQLEEAP